MHPIFSTATWGARAGAVSLSGVCFAFGLGAGAVQADATLPQTSQLYGQAVAYLEAGDTASAVLALERVVLENPTHAGARLDLVLAHCALGSLPLAQSHLRALQALNGVPVSLLQLAEAATASGCSGRARGERVWASAGLSLGHTSNVNAGPSSERIWFAPGAPLQSLDFAPESLPRSDWLKAFSAGAGYGRWALQGEFRKHHHESSYDAVQLQASRLAPASGVASFSEARWSAFVGAWWQRRGSKEYSLGIAYEAWAEEKRGPGRFGFGVKAVALDYPREPSYRSARLEFGPRVGGRLGTTHVAAGIDLTYDQALEGRPGGNRVGTQLSLDASRPLLGGQFQASLLAQAYRDQEPFNALFFGDLHREARRIYTTAGLAWPLPSTSMSLSRLSAYFRITSDRSSDSTGLYSYDANQILIGVRAGF